MKKTKCFEKIQSILIALLATIILFPVSWSLASSEEHIYNSEQDQYEKEVEFKQSDIDRSKKELLDAEYQLQLAKQKVRIKERKISLSRQKLNELINGKKSFYVDFYENTPNVKQLAKPEWLEEVCSIDPQIPYNQINHYYNAIIESYNDSFTKNGKNNERYIVLNQLKQLQKDVLLKLDQLQKHHITKYPDATEQDVSYSSELTSYQGSYSCSLSAHILILHQPMK
jgi:hypothetical protein